MPDSAQGIRALSEAIADRVVERQRLRDRRGYRPSLSGRVSRRDRRQAVLNPRLGLKRLRRTVPNRSPTEQMTPS